MNSRLRTTSVACVLLFFAGALLATRPASGGEILTSESKLYSQFDEELIIRDFFGDRRGGFFVDVGCAFPKKNSTTYYLEKHLGWSGIGVDALPRYAQRWKKLRPNSEFVAFAVTDRSGEAVTFWQATVPTVSSLSKKQAANFSRGKVKPIKVGTITLTKLLDDRGVTEIDFLSIDIEGSEPAALAGFDVERFRPELVAIEVMLKNTKKISDYFTSHGYERIEEYQAYDLINWYFRPKSP